MRVRYQTIAKHRGQTQEWIAYEDNNLEKAIKETKKLKKQYPHLLVKLIKVTEERIKL